MGSPGLKHLLRRAHPGSPRPYRPPRGLFRSRLPRRRRSAPRDGALRRRRAVRRSRATWAIQRARRGERFRTVASAVAHCHARGVLHRDLKPENILLVRDPSVPLCAAPLTTKVADFGLGVSLVAGERAKGAADVWSLGVILYILLSGVPPFWGATDKDVFVEVLRGAVDMSGPEWSGVSEEAKHLVRCLLQRDPARRPSAAAILSHPWILRSCTSAMLVLATWLFQRNQMQQTLLWRELCRK
ncbi:hypothetical protein CLOM_g21228 [Closterium sp. NIES-68]|nr:hypothetical protein CLOM_g21228 [Closterium sp. NIES-68]